MSAADAGLYPEPDGTATGGWSGSASSRDRAVYEETSGVRGSRQRQVLDLVRASGARGMTDREVQQALVIGHGSSSGTLTRLHRQGLLERLLERREHNEVYVLPEHAGDRPRAAYRPLGMSVVAGLRYAAQRLDEDAAEAERRLQRVGPAAPDAALRLRTTRDVLRAQAMDFRRIAQETQEAARTPGRRGARRG